MEIHNWLRLDGRVTTSGQPTEAQLVQIRDLGVLHVVNLGLHTHDKALKDERSSVEALGMRYGHIPVDFTNPTEDDFGLFCAMMRQHDQAPIHVHCIANFRVSAFLYRFRRDVSGEDEAVARADMEKVWKPDGVWEAFTTKDRERKPWIDARARERHDRHAEDLTHGGPGRNSAPPMHRPCATPSDTDLSASKAGLCPDPPKGRALRKPYT